MMSRPKNVLLALGWYDHRLLQGIATYAAEHHWHLAAHSIIHEKVIPWGWSGDGVLAWLAAGDDLAQFVVSVEKPTVDFSLRRPHLPFAHVAQDHAQAGQLVAEHFLERGLKRFCFYSDSENWSHVERGESFTQELARRGFECAWLRWHQHDTKGVAQGEWLRRRAWLIAHLKESPKPLAVFTANGTLAVEVRELCESEGIHVPSQVAIVGIDDYLLAVRATSTAISGVDTNLERQGYEGAALLGRMMEGEKQPAKPVRIPPAGVITRRSSDVLAVSHEGVVQALRYIADHFSHPIGVEDVAAAALMSRRGLHQAFCEHVGCTPGDKIRGARIEAAKRMLAESTDKIGNVARRCGYPNLNTFFAAFRKVTGMTPAEFRKCSHPVG
jgi:LacI family transcriptional regulator